MKRTLQMIAVGLLLTLSAGCAPESDEACKHMIELMKNDPERPGFLKDMDTCNRRMDGVKRQFGVNNYRREVECALEATTAYKLRQCFAASDKDRDGVQVRP